MRAGLIPSRALQERRIVHERNELNGDSVNLCADKSDGNIFLFSFSVSNSSFSSVSLRFYIVLKGTAQNSSTGLFM